MNFAWFCSPAGQKARTLKCLNYTFRDIVKLSNEEIHSRKSSYAKDVTMWTIKKLIYFLVFWHSFKQFEHNWLVVAFAPKSYRSDPRKFIWAVNSGQMPKCYHNLWGVMRYRSTKSRSVTDARHSSELFSLFMFETWFNEVVWKCDRWPQTEESQLASQLQNCRAYGFNLAIMDHFVMPVIQI